MKYLINHLSVLFYSLALSFICLAYADESKRPDKSFADNLSSEYATCAAYYTVMVGALTHSGESELADQYSRNGSVAFDYALEFAKDNRTEEMANSVTTSRFTMYAEGMMKEIGNDASNVSILLNQYAYRCKEALEDPERFAKKILAEILR